MNTKDTAHAHGVESAVVDQAPDRFWMHAELRRNLSDADQAFQLSLSRRHSRC